MRACRGVFFGGYFFLARRVSSACPHRAAAASVDRAARHSGKVPRRPAAAISASGFDDFRLVAAAASRPIVGADCRAV